MNKKQLFEKYVTENLNSIYRFAFTYAKNPTDAEDIVSESILKGLKNIHRLKDENAIKPWIYQIVANTSLSYIKHNSRYVHTDENTEEIWDKYTDYDLNTVINSLPEKYKEIIVLKFFEDLKIADVATVLNISENTVKTRLYKGLRLLKAELGDDYLC